MKIRVTKTEFAELIRSCDRVNAGAKCWQGCVFGDLCSRGLDLYEGKIMSRIEDICEIIPECGRNG